ncbi:MAG: DUF2905 family protein [Flavobacteriaceae bacterium]
MGKSILMFGLLLVAIGALLWFLEGQNWSYKNPLDFRWQRGHTKVYFPLGTSLLASVILSLLFYVLKK